MLVQRTVALRPTSAQTISVAMPKRGSLVLVLGWWRPLKCFRTLKGRRCTRVHYDATRDANLERRPELTHALQR